MKYAILAIVLIFTTPVLAQAYDDQVNPGDNSFTSNFPDSIQQQRDDWQAQEAESQREEDRNSYNSSSPAETLYDCGQSGNCAGAFDPDE